ncbi:MAG TPA: Gfo/Idh/MocA family oxidoreductase [Candidatus Methanoperedens sp.]
MKYKAAIIGCGNIGALYDRPDQFDRILTHAHAYSLEPRIHLCAMADIDEQKADNAAKIWGGKPYSDATEMLEHENIDIISICVPDEHHENMLDLCKSYHPKAVFCEKPITLDVASAEQIVEEYADSGILLAVNYSRRFDTSLMTLKKEIVKGTYGDVLNAIGIYTKGILHNGSHVIDIFNFLFGSVIHKVPLSGRIDWRPEDPTLDAYLEFSEGAKAHLIGADERQFSIFDVDILCEKARFQFIQFGMKMVEYRIRKDPLYPGYKDLTDGKITQTKLNKAMLYAIANIIDTIEKKDTLICSGTDAVIAQKICIELIQEYKKRA